RAERALMAASALDGNPAHCESPGQTRPVSRQWVLQRVAHWRDDAAIETRQSETSRSAGRSLCLVDNLAAGGGRSDEVVKEGCVMPSRAWILVIAAAAVAAS